MRFSPALFFAFSASLLFVCCENKSQHLSSVKDKPKELNYGVISKEESRTSNVPYVLTIRSYIKGKPKNKEEAENLIREIYKQEAKNLIETFQSQKKNASDSLQVSRFPVSIIYLFTSEKLAKNYPSDWALRSTNGYITLNHNTFKGKYKSLKHPFEATNNSDLFNRTKINNLNKYLAEKNLDLCSLNKMLADIELNSFSKAEEYMTVVEYSTKNEELIDEMNEEGKNNLMKKYKLDDSIFIQVRQFSQFYCN